MFKCIDIIIAISKASHGFDLMINNTIRLNRLHCIITTVCGYTVHVKLFCCFISNNYYLLVCIELLPLLYWGISAVTVVVTVSENVLYFEAVVLTQNLGVRKLNIANVCD